MISENGLQFDSKAFRRYCGELGIRNRYSTFAYPQGNGQAEAVNKVIVNGLKKRLDETKGKWWKSYLMFYGHIVLHPEDPLWKFSMIYGSEVVIPLKTGFPTLRSSQFNADENSRFLLQSWTRLMREKRWSWLRWHIINRSSGKGMTKESR